MSDCFAQKKKSIILLLSALLTAVFSFNLHAQSVEADYTHTGEMNRIYRGYALQYVSASFEYLTAGKFAEAAEFARLATVTDPSVSDVWYAAGVISIALDKPAAEALQCLETAFICASWFSSSQDEARLLYARLLVQTGDGAKALDVLSGHTQIYSSDTLVYTAAALYQTGNISEAHAILRQALDLYPEDPRFARMFFKYEKNIKNGQNSGDARQLLSRFTQNIFDSNYSDGGLTAVSAVPFLNPSERIKALKMFSPSEHIASDAEKTSSFPFISDIDFFALDEQNQTAWYALYALSAGIIDKETSFELLLSSLTGSAHSDLIEAAVQSFSDAPWRTRFNEFLQSFTGSIVFDTSADAVPDLFIDYKSGAVQNVYYSEKQDGSLTWSSVFAENHPEEIIQSEPAVHVLFQRYPTQSTVHYEKDNICLTFARRVSALLPFTMEQLNDTPLYFTKPTGTHIPDAVFLFWLSQKTSLPSNERVSTKIDITVKDGVFFSADYSEDGRVYARTYFNDGIPDYRVTDYDGNGNFEMTEYYAFDYENYLQYTTEEKSLELGRRIYGAQGYSAGLYIKKTAADLNNDHVIDFIDNFLPGGQRYTSWDLDFNGEFDIANIYRSDSFEPGSYIGEFCLLNPLFGRNVIRFKGKQPVSISMQGMTVPIIYDKENDFYWIGEKMSPQNVGKIKKSLNLDYGKSVCILDASQTDDQYRLDNEPPGVRVFAMRSELYYYGELITNVP